MVEIEDSAEVSRQEEWTPEINPMVRARRLAGLGVNVLICGGISRPVEMMINSIGVKVIPETVVRWKRLSEPLSQGSSRLVPS